ncbi:uncharacterized protein LOC109823244 [Asparagus officinalis]|uniref:uncharacterized protein LOC109823244 n=1 Tax=Asparagus officinalis TaxID=4686 RepID=UPI00098E2773|nr:uncharacterized protein LOC109823244 [Asparagus officinalis]
MINNQTKIPAEWHTVIRDIGQKFDSTAKVRLALQYYSIVKRISVLPTHAINYGASAGNSRASRKFIAGQIQDVLKVKLDLRAVDIKNDMLSNYGIKINYTKAWKSKETAQQDMFGDDDEAYDSLRWYEAMVHATNPESRVAIDVDDEREKPYNPPHQLVMISDADKGIMIAVKEFFPDAFHSRCVLYLVENFKKKMKDFGYKVNVAQILGDLLQSATYKYTISKWDDYMKKLASIDHRTYVTTMEYSPQRWANAYFRDIRYGHVTSNVTESFNSWIRKARMMRILPLDETIRKQIMERMHERRLMA